MAITILVIVLPDHLPIVQPVDRSFPAFCDCCGQHVDVKESLLCRTNANRWCQPCDHCGCLLEFCVYPFGQPNRVEPCAANVGAAVADGRRPAENRS